MRLTYILILMVLLGTSCDNMVTSEERRAAFEKKKAGGKDNNLTEDNTAPENDASTVNIAPEKSAAGKPAANNWQKLEMVTYKDNKGNVIAEAPYPPTWDANRSGKKGEPSITGPNGIRVVDQGFESFIYSNDPYYQQLYAQSGQTVRPWQGAENIVKQDFVPELRNQGWTLKRWYEVPEVAKVDKWYNDQMYKAVPMQMEIVAIGSEWENGSGEPAFMITHVSVSNTQQLQSWSYYSSVLKADRNHFEAARKQYIFSMANTRYALEPIMEYNKMEAQKAGQSWAAHNQRMAQNQANFEKQQRDFVNRSNSINEAIMTGWEKSNASSDRQHQKTIDGIREEENAYSGSGQQYKTSIHYNNYWLSSDGQYISTNQNSYDPNQDQGLNNQNWQQLKKGDN
ncbi:hypothetical protein BH09BAC1_BH09BAC1_29200 [soil metagenome]